MLATTQRSYGEGFHLFDSLHLILTKRMRPNFSPCGPNGSSVYQKEREPLISSRKRSSWPDYLQEKVKGKFPESFEEAMQWARLKDWKLQFQAHVMRRESPRSTNVVSEQQPHAPPTTSADPHLELLQRVTNQLNELSINMFQESRVPAHQPPNEERAQNAQAP